MFRIYKFLFLFLNIFLCSIIAKGQRFSEYIPLENTSFPVDYTNLSIERYLSLNASNNVKNKKEQQAKEAFYLQNNYVVQDFFKSGVVLFDTAYSAYMKKIAARLLLKDSILLQQSQFYLVRSPAVNAFATQDGSVFIYMGLMAALRSEAELAFVIAHELAHIREQHALDLFLKNQTLLQSKDKKRIFENSQPIKKIEYYSQQNEIRADEYGYEQYFKDSGYRQSAAEAVLDVLRYAYLPFENKPFTKELFEDKLLIFPNDYELKQLKQVGAGTEYNYKETDSHPSIAVRRAKLRSIYQKTAVSKDFLVSEPYFLFWREQCKAELPHLFLHYNNFQEAIYASYLLLHERPNNFYLKKCIAKSLYGFAKFRNDTTETCDAETIDYRKIEGESQQLYFFLQQLDAFELNILALNYVRNLTLTYKDIELNSIQKDLISDLATYHCRSLEVLNGWIDDRSIYFTPTLAKLSEDKVVINLLALEWVKNSQNKAVFNRNNKKEERVKRLNISKIIVANHTFQNIDNRKNKIEVDYYASLLGENIFENAVVTNAKKAKLDIVLLPTAPLTTAEKELDRFNKRVVLNDWFWEQVAFNDIPFLGYQEAKVREISLELGTPYILWTGAVQIRRSKDGFKVFGNIAMGLGIYPLLPYAAYSTFKADYDTLIYGVLYNTETREKYVLKYERVQGNQPEAIINSHLYDMFNQIRHQ